MLKFIGAPDIIAVGYRKGREIFHSQLLLSEQNSEI